jgi:CelD/BcsL family acetyltransferase involved in cellulose biosynthesis
MLAAVQSAARTSAATVEVICDVSAFADLRPEWTRLLASSKSNCVFLTWEWLYTWWSHLGGDRRLWLLTVRTEDGLVAVAPFGLRPRFRFGLLETVEFLGSGCVGSDYLDIIAKEGCEDLAVAALLDYLTKQQHTLKLANVRSNALAADLARALPRSQWTLSDTRINICPYVPLSGFTWESYLATLGSEHRYSFRRKWQRVNRDFTVEWDSPRSSAECRRAIDFTIELHNLRWAGRGQSDAFHTPELVAFHHEVAPLAFKRGWLRVYLLRLNGRPAASLYGFLYGEKFYFYQSGFDPAYAKYGVGLLAMGLAIQEALKERASEFDLLHGDESYKTHWTPVHREIRRLELFPANTLGCLSNISVDMIRKARKMALGVLHSGQ